MRLTALLLCLCVPQFAPAADDEAKCRARQVKAALALAAAKGPDLLSVAPMPRSVSAKSASCICGSECKCATGDCPAKCPTAKPAAVPVKSEVWRYEQRCINGQCHWVLVKE